jgi:hypothetical protein
MHPTTTCSLVDKPSLQKEGKEHEDGVEEEEEVIVYVDHQGADSSRVRRRRMEIEEGGG